MRVRVANLLGKDVHEATLSEVEDELEPTGKKWVVEVRPAGGEPMQMDWSSADELELVEATDAERAAHAEMLAKQREINAL